MITLLQATGLREYSRKADRQTHRAQPWVNTTAAKVKPMTDWAPVDFDAEGTQLCFVLWCIPRYGAAAL